MENFPSNSSNPLGKPPRKEKPQKPQLEKVTTGEVIQTPIPLRRKFKDLFFGGEFRGASRYILADVLLPALRNMVVDATTKGIERVIYGESTPRRRSDIGSRARIAYNTPVDRFRDGRMSAMLPDQPPLPSSRRREANRILLSTREEAELVLERLVDVVDKYGEASVADLHDLVGLPTTYVDNNWGWTNLRGTTITQDREGFELNLPLIEPIS